MIPFVLLALYTYFWWKVSHVFSSRPDVHLFDPTTRESYLRRWHIFKTRWFVVYVHNLEGPDVGRDLHDHPRSSVGLVLRGGYMQVIYRFGSMGETVELVRWVNVLRLRDFHRIVDVKPNTWTLFIGGPKRRDWGFSTRKGFVDHATYRERFPRPRLEAE